jgi:CheY-like chemotaxis protein
MPWLELLVHDKLRAALRVLIVDDDPVNRDATCDALLWDRCEVAVASTAEQALEMVRSAPPDIIVISGPFAVAMDRELRVGLLSRLPVIALSSSEDVVAVDAILRSPVDALELLATVRLLTGSRVVLQR